jgi:hypothetical protein
MSIRHETSPRRLSPTPPPSAAFPPPPVVDRGLRAGTPASVAGMPAVRRPNSDPRVERPRPTRPDPMPLRVAFGMGGVAAAAALLATIATSALPATNSAVTDQAIGDASNQAAAAAQGSGTSTTPVAPGTGGSTGSNPGTTTNQRPATATPQQTPSIGVQVPAPTPRPRRQVIITRQSGGQP